MKEEGTHFEGDIFVLFFVGVHIAQCCALFH